MNHKFLVDWQAILLYCPMCGEDLITPEDRLDVRACGDHGVFRLMILGGIYVLVFDPERFL